MIGNIEEKQKELESIGNTLKSQFRGIDNVIDSIIKQIETWYIFDKILYKPTIVCLWGMTSCGKTTLVRNLAKLLNIYEKYVEINMSHIDGIPVRVLGSSNSPFADKIFNTIKDSSDKGIILIDEIQRVTDIASGRTSGELWSLLSDGTLGDDHAVLRRVDYAIDNVDRYIKNFMDKINETVIENRESLNDIIKNSWNPISQPIPLSMNYIIEQVVSTVNIDSFDDLNPIFDYNDFGPVKSRYPFGFRNRLRYAYDSGQMSIEDILYMPNFVYINPLKKILENHRKRLVEQYNRVSGKDPSILSKMLIFISGNIDGLYTECKDTNISADELHEKTLKLTLNDLKNELLKVFRPEEVSRFGGQHIIYPSLSSSAFKEIIRDKLKLVEEDVKQISDIDISLRTDKFVDHLFDIGVVACQGARPLISRIFSELNGVIPKLIKHAKFNDKTCVSVDEIDLNS